MKNLIIAVATLTLLSCGKDTIQEPDFCWEYESGLYIEDMEYVLSIPSSGNIIEEESHENKLVNYTDTIRGFYVGDLNCDAYWTVYQRQDTLATFLGDSTPVHTSMVINHSDSSNMVYEITVLETYFSTQTPGYTVDKDWKYNIRKSQ